MGFTTDHADFPGFWGGDLNAEARRTQRRRRRGGLPHGLLIARMTWGLAQVQSHPSVGYWGNAGYSGLFNSGAAARVRQTSGEEGRQALNVQSLFRSSDSQFAVRLPGGIGNWMSMASQRSRSSSTAAAPSSSRRSRSRRSAKAAATAGDRVRRRQGTFHDRSSSTTRPRSSTRCAAMWISGGRCPTPANGR